MDKILGQHFRGAKEPWSDSVSLYATCYTTDSKGTIYGFAATIDWVEKDEGADMAPFAKLTYSEAQELIDSLWQAGMRPTEGKGSAGQLAATEKHLEDMRDMVSLLIGQIIVSPDKVADKNN